ncbi:MAG TPA: SDR family NAD(P)-dependent oxidoreductase [Rhabdochlamydiaceae bacterium]|nr:SDR family NAD(P)-dependent oxidoreductase [Rhabdochlamydiaceae bacterium]
MKKFTLSGQTALITGASSGIGKACAEQFAALGVHLVITARRLERLNALAKELSSKQGIKVVPMTLDVQKNKEVDALFKHLEEKNIPIDILVNNAGLALSSDKMQDAQISNWETMIDTNLKGLLYVTKAALNPMIKRNRGHIINIGSTAGHECYATGNIYCATKFAVRAISKSLRLDLMGTAIRVSEIDPGAVETEFSEIRWKDKEKAKKFYEDFTPLVADDIADAVVYCATRPPHVNISELIIFPQAQASLSNVYRAGQPPRALFTPK